MGCPYIIDKGDKLLCQRQQGKNCDVVDYTRCPVFRQGFFGNPERPVRTFVKP